VYKVNDRVQFLIRGIYSSRAINAWLFDVTVSSSKHGNGVRIVGFEVLTEEDVPPPGLSYCSYYNTHNTHLSAEGGGGGARSAFITRNYIETR
jgi:hypothetical protein